MADKLFNILGGVIFLAMAGTGAIYAGLHHGWQIDQLFYGALSGLMVFGVPIVAIGLLVAFLLPRRR